MKRLAVAAAISALSCAPSVSISQDDTPPPSISGEFAGEIGSDGTSHKTALPSYLALVRAVFQSNRDGNWEIYTAFGDGTQEVRLTNNTSSDIKPRLNQSANRIVFASDREGNFEVYVINVDGTGLQRLTFDGAQDTDPTWSPAGDKIAFVSTRAGQAEIYVMNSDGSGLARLTNDPSPDTRPAWSPDGAQIAFVSTRGAAEGTGGRIWLMDASGSNPRAISVEPDSDNPIWSPDGTQLAYDAQHWIIGRYLHVVLRKPVNAPTGLFLVTGDVYAGGNVCCVSAYAGAWLLNGNLVAYTDARYGVRYLFLSSNGVINSPFVASSTPDLKPLDLTPPTTSVAPMPPISTASFMVTWSGSALDGPAHAFSYEIQAREGLTGTWTPFASASDTDPTQKVFTGVAGHTYYFRSRGIDVLNNVEVWPADFDAWTTIETSPPISSMDALAPLILDRSIRLSWSGVDPGGSGVASYDIEFQVDEAAAWVPLLTRTPLTGTLFRADPGHVYAFRARAIDAAGNIEAWRPGDGDAHTRVSQAVVFGQVHDNSGTPIRGAQVGSWPVAGPDQAPTANDGSYDRIALTETVWLIVAVPSVYVDSPPPVRVRTVTDTILDFYLPPFDNVIQNPGFEDSLTNADWLPAGQTPPRLTGASRHTGERGITVGGYGFSDPETVSRSATDGFGGVLALNTAGDPHLVWTADEGALRRILYSTRLSSGIWMTPERVAGASQGEVGASPDTYRPELAIDPAGTVHVLWRTWPEGVAYYAQKPVSGAWTSPYTVTTGLDTDSLPRLAIDPTGVAHIVWHDGNGSRRDIFYARRDAAGNWSATENLTGADPYATESRLPAIRVDLTGTATLAWQNGVGQYIAGFYATRPVAGGWSAPLTLLMWPFALSEPRIEIDAFGASHLAWRATLANGMNAIAYATARGAQVSPLKLVYTSPLALTLDRIIVDRAGNPHLAWTRSDGETLHATPGARSAWSVTNLSNSPAAMSREVDLAATTSGVWAAWHEQAPGGEAVAQCKKWTASTGWVDYGICALALEGSPVLASGADDVVHLGHASLLESPREVMHAAWLDAPVGPSAISQVVTQPIALNTPGLSFLYRLEGVVSDVAPLFTVTAASAFSVTEVFTASALTGPSWQHVWRDMSAFAGQAITLTLTIDPRDGSGGARLALDEVSLGSTAPDLWVDSALPVEIRPETTQTMTLRFGNRGGGNATGAIVTMTLPAGLTFDSAEPAPTSSAPVLVWQLPAIPPGVMGPSIALTLSIGAGAAGSVVTPTITIASAIPELELANNAWRSATFVGYRAYLPVIRAP